MSSIISLGGKLDKNNLIQFMKDLKQSHPDMTDEEAAKIAASKIADSKPKSRMYYKIGASREMAGGKKVDPKRGMSEKLKDGYASIGKAKPQANKEASTTGKATIEFQIEDISVLENAGRFPIYLVRTGDSSEEVDVMLDTMDGSAVAGEDYIAVHEVVKFRPGVTEVEVTMEVLNDDAWEPDEDFFVKLSFPDKSGQHNYKFGSKKIMKITTLNDDEPGTFQFKQKSWIVKESCGVASLTVTRENGADGEVSLEWRTVNKTAVNNKDFVGGEGQLVFKTGEMAKDIMITIIDDMSANGKEEYFEVELVKISEGAKIGGMQRTKVTIADDEEFQEVLTNMMEMTNANLSDMCLYQSSWSQQLKNAMTVNGGELEGATFQDYLMHFCTFGVKFLFALAPPPGYGSGWPCFWVSLIFIGIMVVIITDLASIFGCLVGLKDEVTAITIITFGTSQIDLFASKISAINDPTADNSLGNVVAANAIGVFLGLGWPWLVASCYWQYVDPRVGFQVPASDLSFLVLAYTGCAVPALGLIVIRRKLSCFGNAELGGDATMKYVSSGILFGLWFLFVTMTSLNAYGFVENPLQNIDLAFIF